MKTYSQKILALIPLLLLSCANAAADAQLSASYKTSNDSYDQHYVDLLKNADALPAIISFINEFIPLNQNVNILVGAEDGPLYDPQTNEIWLPLSFLSEIENRFSDASIVKTAEEKEIVIIDVVMHTLVHEIAHAIIAQFEIPTLGREEDAADNLANVLLLEHLEHGNEIVLNAADMYALEDQDTDEFDKEHFWGVHSLDIQRYYSTLCHVYGSDPTLNQDLVDSGELSAEKADQCIDDYELIASDWHNVLEELVVR